MLDLQKLYTVAIRSEIMILNSQVTELCDPNAICTVENFKTQCLDRNTRKALVPQLLIKTVIITFC